jgi:quercetin dioxygenase-like cupin family protein
MKSRAILLLPCLALFALAQTATAPAVPVLEEPHHHLAIENEYVRVFKVEVLPHAETLLHRHDHDYVFVTIGDARVVNAPEGKAPVELKLADGETRFTRAPLVHVAKNLSGQSFRNVTIELIQDQANRDAAGTFPEVVSPEVQKVLFVQDGVRVSEYRLAPGATLPRHEHKRPHLVVAVSDLDLRSDVEGQGPMPGKFKAGDVKWLPGGYSHTLTNTGQKEARFVTLEF